MEMEKPVVLFDGVCNLCNKTVLFVIKRDRERKFRFASLQSPFGQMILGKYSIPANEFNSFILLEGEKIYTRSTGALRLISRLRGWRWTKIFLFVPRFIRDAVYNLIARNRYKWFGTRTECMIPTPELRDRFIE